MSGTYTVIGQNETCPTLPASTEVTIVPTPQPFLGVDTFFCPPKGESLRLYPGAFETYLWEDLSPLEAQTAESAGVYTVQVWDQNGCAGFDTLLIEERCPATLSMPNAFSPNGDQVNDFFTITSEFVLRMDLSIFDRWGKVVYTSDDPLEAWDGKTPNGSDAPEGVYFWTLEWEGYDGAGNSRVERLGGNVLLVR